MLNSITVPEDFRPQVGTKYGGFVVKSQMRAYRGEMFWAVEDQSGQPSQKTTKQLYALSLGYGEQVQQNVQVDPSFKPKPGDEFVDVRGKNWTVEAYEGRVDGEDFWSCLRDGEEGYRRTTAELFQMSGLKRPPTADEYKRMTPDQQKTALQHFGGAVIERILQADKKSTQAEVPDFSDDIHRALLQHGHVVANQRNVDSINKRMAQHIAERPNEAFSIEQAIAKSVMEGLVSLDLRPSGLSQKYDCDILEPKDYQRKNGLLTPDELVTLARPSANRPWYADKSAAEIRKEAGLDAHNADFSAPSGAAQEQARREEVILAAFRKAHPEIQFENLDGAAKCAEYLRNMRTTYRGIRGGEAEVGYQFTVAALEEARRHLLQAGEIHETKQTVGGVETTWGDGQRTIKTGGMTMVVYERRGNAQAALSRNHVEVVEPKTKKYTPDQIEAMSAAEYASHMNEPDFVEAVNGLGR